MSHALVTVFVSDSKTLAEMFAPFNDQLEVEEHDGECWCMWRESVPKTDCSECHGTGVYRTTSNPRSKWDYWTALGTSEYIDARYPSLTGVTSAWDTERKRSTYERGAATRELNGLTTFAILTPDEGWIDRSDAHLYEYGEDVDIEAQEQEWGSRFKRAYDHYSALEGYSVVVCDYHS